LFTNVIFFSLRMRPGAFVPIKCRLPECPRLILPLAVILKRFLAPRCVFNFNFGFDAFLGIAKSFPHSTGGINRPQESLKQIKIDWQL
jgi:hypothetical protein